MKRTITSAALILFLLFGLVPAYAENNGNKSNENKQEKIEVKAQVKLARSLSRGISGDDVKQLQEWLAKDKDIYPEGFVSGYYGALTEKAVKKFQKKYGIEQLGIVGPKTRAKLEEAFRNYQNTVKDILKNADDITPLASTTSGHKLTLCHKGGGTISVDIHAIAAHLNHGDTVGACNGTSTTTDKTAPNIFGVFATPSITTASVNWSTDESSDSRVWYATSSPVLSASSKATVSNSTLLTSHSLNLTGLSTSTTYFYVVVSKDASGNTATSTEGSFTTQSGPSADITPPLIFGAFTIPSVNSASVSWMTNEPANSRIWYATALDVMGSPTRATVFDSSLTTSRSLNLTGLMANTQYYFLLVDADASLNTATSTSNLYTFMTSPLSLSSVTAVPASTTANVTWQTNVSTDSTVHYATSSPVLSASSHATVTGGASVVSHSVGLSGLATSTTYYYLVVSKDAFGNSATSSESSFVTLSN